MSSIGICLHFSHNPFIHNKLTTHWFGCISCHGNIVIITLAKGRLIYRPCNSQWYCWHKNNETKFTPDLKKSTFVNPFYLELITLRNQSGLALYLWPTSRFLSTIARWDSLESTFTRTHQSMTNALSKLFSFVITGMCNDSNESLKCNQGWQYGMDISWEARSAN